MDKDEIEKAIEKESKLIAELEANPPNNQERYSNGSPKGEYAIYCTKLQDCYWRRRNLQDKLRELTI